jgi:hypothetical protein
MDTIGQLHADLAAEGAAISDLTSALTSALLNIQAEIAGLKSGAPPDMTDDLAVVEGHIHDLHGLVAQIQAADPGPQGGTEPAPASTA